MRIVAGVVLGAALGVLCTSFGLIDLTPAHIQFGGGNEWTPWLTGSGALVGALIGATSFFRRRALGALLLGLALIVAIALRDRYQLQPPSVFLDLFGLPILGAVLGTLLDRWREKSNARPGVIAAIGAAAIAVVVAVVAVTGNGNRTSNCETTGKFIRCSQLRSGG